MNKRFDLRQLKTLLPLLRLMQLLGFGDGKTLKLRCPFHADNNPSFSAYQTNTGNWAWKCFAGCGSGDEVSFLAKHLRLDPQKEFKKVVAEYARLAESVAGVPPVAPAQAPAQSKTAEARIDWEACQRAATPAWLGSLASARGYSLGLVAYLHQHGLIGSFENQPAFPVTHDGKVVAIHTRTRKTWLVLPGGPIAPLIIGNLATAVHVHGHESQWDAFAMMDCLGWHQTGIPADTAILITRGAGNGKMASLARSDAIVFAWVQNDAPNPKSGKIPAQEWLKEVCAHAGNVRVVKTPAPHKDANDWLRAGASRQDFLAAVEHAKPTAVTVEPASEGPASAQLELFSPNEWFAQKFPTLPKIYGDAALLVSRKNGDLPYVKKLSEDFLAATLSDIGSPEQPAVYLPHEDRFYRYDSIAGIFRLLTPQCLESNLSGLILDCARACSESSDTRDMQFRLRDSAVLQGVTRRAKGLLAKSKDFFQSDLREFIAADNGMLRVADKQLLPFASGYRRRNKLGVGFIPDAKCERFLNELMQPAMSAEDLELLQRWAGMALLIENVAQRLVILTGTAGGGKGTFIRLVSRIVGLSNIGSLRTNQLAERFEIGLLMDKTLLYGPDVPEDFLNRRGASTLKALTGGDPVSPELKHATHTETVFCSFNVIVSCNSHLKVHLEGDVGAWRRRLVIIQYNNVKPAKPIADFDKVLFDSEGPGILNWMLEGVEKLRADGWQLKLSPAQQARVDDLLLESDSLTVFVADCLRLDPKYVLTVNDCYESYVRYCQQRNWVPLNRNDFGSEIGEVVTAKLGLAQRHDVPDTTGKNQRGWKGVLCLP